MLDSDGNCRLSAEEFDVLLSRAERGRDLLAGATAWLRGPNQLAPAAVADLLAEARTVLAAIASDLEGAQARAFEQRREHQRIHAQALKHVGGGGQ